ncbi:DUF1573 domain-containing protein [Candidatus Peregrinibacteria bacterium]|nr:MAG: DUF1573 domain-containing protein [Candidatus Peregrinibacteria bacterium]
MGLLLLSVVLVACSQSPQTAQTSSPSGKVAVLESAVYDWGNLDITGGKVEHTFRLKNDSNETLWLNGAQTSCMCTTARYQLEDGSSSPQFGMHNNAQWSAAIKPNQTFQVAVTFDPMAHGPTATGPIQRSIWLSTSATDASATELKVSGTVLSQDDYQKAVVPTPTAGFKIGDFVFAEKEFDFGVLKQSGGVVSHQYPFTYQGETPIKITGAVGSCACTQGRVDVQEMTKGSQGILTVEFDPNLHEEPKGRFFKTVALITEPKLAESIEVKMWAEIDLDLGPEAYKLQGPHQEDDEIESHN